MWKLQDRIEAYYLKSKISSILWVSVHIDLQTKFLRGEGI